MPERYGTEAKPFSRDAHYYDADEADREVEELVRWCFDTDFVAVTTKEEAEFMVQEAMRRWRGED